MSANENSISIYRDQCLEALKTCDALKRAPNPLTKENLQKMHDVIIAIEGIYVELERKSYQLKIDNLRLQDDNYDLNSQRSKLANERHQFEAEQKAARLEFEQEREEVRTRVHTQHESHTAELKKVVDLYNVSLQRQAAQIHSLKGQLQKLQPQPPSEEQEVVFWA